MTSTRAGDQSGSLHTGQTELGQHLELHLLEIESVEAARELEWWLAGQIGVLSAQANHRTGVVHLKVDADRVQMAELLERLRERGLETCGEMLRLRIEGMHCASCTTRIEDALQAVPGVLDVSVSPATETADVSYVQAATDVSRLAEAIESSGYQVRKPPTPDAPERDSEDRDREYRELMRKFWFAAIISLPVMFFSWKKLATYAYLDAE